VGRPRQWSAEEKPCEGLRGRSLLQNRDLEAEMTEAKRFCLSDDQRDVACNFAHFNIYPRQLGAGRPDYPFLNVLQDLFSDP